MVEGVAGPAPGSSVKTAVVFYTRFGHTAVVAREVAEKLVADLFQIEEARNYTFPELGRAAFTCHFEIKPMQLDYTAYQRLVLCTPIWMREPACPARTFLRDARLTGLEVYALFSSISGEMDHAAETVAEYLGRQNAKLVLKGSVLTAKTTDEELRREADDFVKRLRS